MVEWYLQGKPGVYFSEPKEACLTVEKTPDMGAFIDAETTEDTSIRLCRWHSADGKYVFGSGYLYANRYCPKNSSFDGVNCTCDRG